MSVPIEDLVNWSQKAFSTVGGQLNELRLQFSPSTARECQTASDPHNASQLFVHAFSHAGVWKLGRIQMGMPGVNWYRVALEEGNSVQVCCRLQTDTTPTFFGTNDCSVFEPDTLVLVYQAPSLNHGIIVGAVPEQVSDGNDMFSDFVVQGSNVGFLRSQYYTDYMQQLGDNGGVYDFSNHRPLDELTFDWGKTTDTGISLHLDPFMFQIRVNEFCGLTGFYSANSPGLLRIRGYQLETDSAVHSEHYYDDEGENIYFRGETPYSWEANGLLKPEVESCREVDDLDVLHVGIESKLEPLEADQMPFFRYREYGGYLGQGRLRLMVLPPKALEDSEEPYTYTSEEAERGVFREHVQMDGQFVLESAKGILISKRRIFAVPKQIRLHLDDHTEDADSSENENYRFAGQFGAEGTEEHVVGDLETDEEQSHLLKAAAIHDVHSYLTNWKTNHPFSYRKGDFSLPEESEISEEATAYVPPFDRLETEDWLPPPESRKEKVDHRYGETAYVDVTSFIHMDEDGGIVISGANGEEIRLLGGNIELSCPGSVFIKPGKSVVGLAGKDIIMRANKSVDITSTVADVRLKAEHNMQLIAGNGAENNDRGGCLLLENRSRGIRHDYPDKGGEAINGSGVIIKVPASEFAVMSREIYLRTGSSPNIAAGNITLDADKGNRDVRVASNNCQVYAKTKITQTFGFPTAIKANTFDSTETVLGSPLRVDGHGHFNGLGAFNGYVYAVDGEFESREGRPVAKIADLPAWEARMKDVADTAEENRDEQQKLYQEAFTKRFYKTGAIGSKKTQRKISGSLRTEAEYGTENFVLPQSRWQAMNEQVKAGSTWVERNVRYQGSNDKAQQPWPGKESWTKETMLSFTAKDYKFYDAENGIAKDRTDEAYKERKLAKLQKKVPQDSYYIISTR
jgi:hypothetical protein